MPRGHPELPPMPATRCDGASGVRRSPMIRCQEFTPVCVRMHATGRTGFEPGHGDAPGRRDATLPGPPGPVRAPSATSPPGTVPRQRDGRRVRVSRHGGRRCGPAGARGLPYRARCARGNPRRTDSVLVARPRLRRSLSLRARASLSRHFCTGVDWSVALTRRLPSRVPPRFLRRRLGKLYVAA